MRFLSAAASLLIATSCLVQTANSQQTTNISKSGMDSQAETKTAVDPTMIPGPVVDIKTTLGDIKVKLYDDTPQHRDNFLKLVNEGAYDSVLFHRVIKDFMVQTGDPQSKNAGPDAHLGAGDPGYTIEAEIKYPRHFHKYGALAAARTGDQVNPEKRSSGSQFYIVTGRKYDAATLEGMKDRMTQKAMQNRFRELTMENRDSIQALQKAGDSAGLENLRLELIKQTEASVKPVELPQEVVDAYTTVGGTPHLDGEYTVFGEVISGMDVVEKIQNSPTGAADRPTEDIRILSVKAEKGSAEKGLAKPAAKKTEVAGKSTAKGKTGVKKTK